MTKLSQFHTKIVGSTFVDKKQDQLRNLQNGQTLQFKREPENQFDKNAVAVYNGDQKLGYVPAPTAENLAPEIDAGHKTFKVQVSEITGRDQKNVGCNLLVEVFGDEGSQDERDYDLGDLPY